MRAKNPGESARRHGSAQGASKLYKVRRTHSVKEGVKLLSPLPFASVWGKVKVISPCCSRADCFGVVGLYRQLPE